MTRVGIFGGTFDPIHLGHLAAAAGAAHLAALDRVVFMPNRQSPLKLERPLTPPEQRAAMVRLAIAGNPRFGLSELELEREGPSYTIDTVRKLLDRHADWQLSWIVGMDSLEEIPGWRDYETLLTLVDFLVVTRPGYHYEQAVADLPAGLRMERVRVLEIPGVDVSATRLRELAAAGYPLRYLVPDPVAEYIAAQKLYGV